MVVSIVHCATGTVCVPREQIFNITWHVQGLSNFFSMQSPSGAVVIRRVLHVPHAFLRPIQLDHKLDFVVRKVGRRHCCRSKIVVTSPLGQANAAVGRPLDPKSGSSQYSPNSRRLRGRSQLLSTFMKAYTAYARGRGSGTTVRFPPRKSTFIFNH